MPSEGWPACHCFEWPMRQRGETPNKNKKARAPWEIEWRNPTKPPREAPCMTLFSFGRPPSPVRGRPPLGGSQGSAPSPTRVQGATKLLTSHCKRNKHAHKLKARRARADMRRDVSHLPGDGGRPSQTIPFKAARHAGRSHRVA